MKRSDARRLRHDELLDPGASSDLLLELLRHIDILMVNDSGGARAVGRLEHLSRGALDSRPRSEDGRDQAGRSRRVARRSQTRPSRCPPIRCRRSSIPPARAMRSPGGFMALRRPGRDDLRFPNLRRAMVYGSAMGSLAVEAFGVQRFEQRHPAGSARPGARPFVTSSTFRWMAKNEPIRRRPGVSLDTAEEAKRRIAELVARHPHCARARAGRCASAAWCACPTATRSRCS